MLMSSGALFGWRRTLPHLAGILLGFAVVMTSAIFGLGTLVEKWPWLMVLVRILGAAWLAYMSVRFFKAALRPVTHDADLQQPAVARPLNLFEAVLFQWVNPKAIILAVSAAGAYIALAESVWQRALIIVGVFFVTGVIGCTSWMVAGDVLNRFMSSGRTAPYINGAMGLLILATAAIILIG